MGVAREAPPARAVAALGDELRGAPLGRAAEELSARAAALASGPPAVMAAAGLVLWGVRAVAIGAAVRLPWARRRGAGRRLGGRRRGGGGSRGRWGAAARRAVQPR